MEVIFRSAFNALSNPTPSGDRFYHKLDVIKIENGCRSLILGKKIDRQVEINSYLSDTLIGNVLARAALGDTSGLRSLESISFGDIRCMQNKPFSQLMKEAGFVKDEFASLPSFIKEKYKDAETLVNTANADIISSIADYVKANKENVKEVRSDG